MTNKISEQELRIEIPQFFEKIEKFLLFGVSACKIRTTFFRGFLAGGSTGKERKNI